MFRQLRKTLVATLIAALTVGQVLPAFADSSDSLPDMGTTAGSTLSIGQEMQMGDYYVRQLRGSAPLINDPLLVQYINGLGMRLVEQFFEEARHGLRVKARTLQHLNANTIRFLFVLLGETDHPLTCSRQRTG